MLKMVYEDHSKLPRGQNVHGDNSEIIHFSTAHAINVTFNFFFIFTLCSPLFH